jgi:putative ABC transport system permease protein
MKNSVRPPRLARKILGVFLREDLAEEVEGDLEEKFYNTIQKKSLLHANVNYWYQVLHYLRPFAIRKSRPMYANQYDMIRSNFKIAVRSLLKNRASSFINVFGLTVGLTSCLLIALYVQHEVSFDNFQPKGDRVARVIMEYRLTGSPEFKRGNFTSTKVAPVFARTFPEVESAVRMTDRNMVVRYEDKLITEPNFMYADSSFLDVFASKMLLGNPSKALNGRYKVVLTRSVSRKYFSDKNPLGELLLIGTTETPYEVTGVMEDYPSNSQIKFDFLASFSSMGMNQEETYFDANYTTYLLLRSANALPGLQETITPFMQKEMTGSGADINYILEEFGKIHLYSEYGGFVPNTNIKYLYILSAVALLILIVVCFTYINLSTARSIERAKEVGVRKVIGAAKSQLFWQFIGESGILCVVSIMLSILVAMFAIPYFNQLTGKQLNIVDLWSPVSIFFAIAITLAVSFMAGSYPAVILSGIQPVKVLKGVFRNTSSGKWIQRSLIVFQFAISAFLIIATVIIQQQLHFIQHKKLGYDRDHILVMPLDDRILKDIALIKQELKTNADVIHVSSCRSTPVKIAGGYHMRSAMMLENEQIVVTASPIDEDYIKTVGLEIISGSDLTEQDMRDVSSDSVERRIYHFILNESAARRLGWTPEQAIDKKMFMSSRSGTVKAVIKDFHFESLHNDIKPLVLFPESRGRNLLVKVSGNDLESTVSFVESKWKQLIPFMPFEYRFLDDDYTELYRSELQLGIVMNLFAGIAIVLACLGLFGLSSYVVKQRVKEIGIRKILGASLFNIVGLLAGNFTKLVVIAILIASPVGYLVLNYWLQEFAYRIEIHWTVLGIVALFAVGIALLTVSFQSIKAGLMNPTESLRSE